MLSPDHVIARRKKGELMLTTLDATRAERALSLAAAYYEIAEAHVGETREALDEAFSAVTVGARERKLGDGVKKLVEDGLEFEVALDVDPVALRKEVFERAAAARRALAEEERFDRDALLTEIARARGLDAEQIERGLFADLKGAHVLTAVTSRPPVALVRDYDLEQARAVLLRAARVTVWLRDADPQSLRALFRKLKFQRLLYRIEREPDGAHRIDLDGPFSLFESVTKYGLALAIALPAITACGRWQLEADVRWGKKRDPLVFRLAGDAQRDDELVPGRLPDEVAALLARFEERGGPWRASVADEILDVPGAGLCVPDLAFTHDKTGEVVLLEVMGFWSREAVWRRVELVEAGLDRKILFAVSKRLRVSEEVLGDDVPAALYVFKGVMSPKQVEDKLDLLARA